MDEAINGGHRHHAVVKQLIPIVKRLIGRDEQAAALIPMSNELKQDAAFLIALFDIAQIVENENGILVEFDKSTGQTMFFLGQLQFLHQCMALVNFTRMPASTWS